ETGHSWTIAGDPSLQPGSLDLDAAGEHIAYFRKGPDGRSEMRLLDLDSGNDVAIWTEVANIHAVRFSPDGRYLGWSYGIDQPRRAGAVAMAIFDRTSKSVRRLPLANTSHTAIAFSPDGRRLAVGNRDRFIRIWDLAGDKEILARQLPAPVEIKMIAF